MLHLFSVQGYSIECRSVSFGPSPLLLFVFHFESRSHVLCGMSNCQTATFHFFFHLIFPLSGKDLQSFIVFAVHLMKKPAVAKDFTAIYGLALSGSPRRPNIRLTASGSLKGRARWWLETQSTSITAQGGGGSFKKTKPIEEIGCCESRMGRQKHWWIELSNCLTAYLATWLPDWLSNWLTD